MEKQAGIHSGLEYESFTDLYKKNYNYVYGVAFLYVKDKTLAEDVTSEVFLTIHRKLESFRKDSQFGTWLYKVTRNTALMVLRKERRHVMGRVEYLSEETYDKMDPIQLLHLEEIERKKLLKNGLKRINEKNRRALELRLLGYDLDEIGEKLEIDNIATVKTKVYRGQKELINII